MKTLHLRPFLVAIFIFILVLTVACQPTITTPEVPPLVGETVDSLVVQPIASSEAPIPPLDDYTGMPDVDGAIAIILSNNLAAKRNLIEYTTVGCTHVDGLGGPPKCEEGVAEGTAITYFPVLGPGHGQPVMPGNIDQTLGFEVSELVAVYQPPADAMRSEEYPIGAYSLLFAAVDGGLPVTVQLTNGRIVRLDFSGFPLDQILQNIHGELIYNRYPQLAVEPTAAPTDKTDNQDGKVVCLPRTNWAEYTIVAGDNLYTLAGNLNTTVAELAQANCLDHPESLMPGQTIYVPTLPATSTPEPTATPVPDNNEPRIIQFAIDQPVFRPGPGETIDVIWNANSQDTEICFNYSPAAYRECQHVPASGRLSHTLHADTAVTNHWLNITIDAKNGERVVSQTEQILLRCQTAWFRDGLSDWCPSETATYRSAKAQWFEGGLIIVEDHYADVIFEEPGTPCLSYKGLPLLQMDTSHLVPPDGRYLPDGELGKLYLGQFPKSEAIRSRLGWATSELVEFNMQMQCEETPDGKGQCFGLAPDGRVYSNTAVSNRLAYQDNIAVGEGACPFVN